MDETTVVVFVARRRAGALLSAAGAASAARMPPSTRSGIAAPPRSRVATDTAPTEEEEVRRLPAAAALALAACSALAAVAAATAGTAPGPRLAGCPVFPPDNPWNRRVDALPVAADSTAIVASIGLDDHVHADFGSGTWDGGPIGIPITIVIKETARSRVGFEYASESDRVPYPIPPGVRIEGGPQADGDRHAILVDRDRCRLYELYALRREGSRWTAGSGATWDLRSNRLRPAGWTSADAAGLPILPGLARYEEVAAGRIGHALRVTVSRTRRAYVWPARHVASDLTDPALPPMGLRLRLRAEFPLAGFPPQARVVLRALKEYGLIVADNGSDWYVSGVPDPRWSNDQLHALHRVPGSAFEVVDASSLRP